MGLSLIQLVLFVSNVIFAIEPAYLDWEESKQRCQTHHSQSSQTYMEVYGQGFMTLLEMADRFEQVYQAGTRIPLHAQYDLESDQFLLFELPYQEPGSLITYEEKRVNMSREFIENVVLQIETAIENQFADYVFHPDMGHSHLYFPEEHWQQIYEPMDKSVSSLNLLYQAMFSDPQLRPLYHLTEKLKVKDESDQFIVDTLLQHKYWNRNFMGTNDGSGNYSIYHAPEDDFYNTVTSIEGFHIWSSGFYIQASRLGCFAYRGKDGEKRYFDISRRDSVYENFSPF